MRRHRRRKRDDCRRAAVNQPMSDLRQDHQRNNFDALRLIAAALVIFSHAFLIAEGNDNHEPMVMLSDRQCALGHVGVFIFFVISGFLVTQSFEATRGALRFAAKRALRIFPGLAASLLVCAFLLGPLVSSLPPSDYLRQPGVYDFVARNFLLDVSVNGLPGVLFADNPVGAIVNGSLWTLAYEVEMYLMVLVLGSLGLLLPPVSLGLLALGVASIGWPALGNLTGGWGWLLGCFAAGMCLHHFRHRRIFDARLALLAAAGLIAAVPVGQFILLFPIFGGYLTIYLALNRSLPILPAARFGDLSYGLYIYGWPLEEAIMFASGGRATWWQVWLLALAGAALLGWLSWHLVERPALRLKPAGASPARRPADIAYARGDAKL
jgi:peptidoglycan/LPS O-acetylase OafA/YrhL